MLLVVNYKDANSLAEQKNFRWKKVLQKRIRNAHRCKSENRIDFSSWAPDEKAMQLNERTPPFQE